MKTNRIATFVILGGLLIAFLLVSLVLGGIYVTMRAMWNSWPYHQAIAIAQTHRDVQTEIGQPLEIGYFIGGSLKERGDDADAILTIPLNGPEGHGVLHVAATKSAGEWQLDRLELKLDDRVRPLNLLAPTSPNPSP